MSKASKQQNNEKEILFSLIKFNEDNLKLFECIPDVWFVDEDQTACYWPPAKGKPFRLRALTKEIPDSSYTISKCVLIRGGFATYNEGFRAVREKINECNTSSADDRLEKLNFRRKHPALALSTKSDFEHLFAKTTTRKQQNVLHSLAVDSVEEKRRKIEVHEKKSTQKENDNATKKACDNEETALNNKLPVHQSRVVSPNYGRLPPNEKSLTSRQSKARSLSSIRSKDRNSKSFGSQQSSATSRSSHGRGSRSSSHGRGSRSSSHGRGSRSSSHERRSYYSNSERLSRSSSRERNTRHSRSERRSHSSSKSRSRHSSSDHGSRNSNSERGSRHSNSKQGSSHSNSERGSRHSSSERQHRSSSRERRSRHSSLASEQSSKNSIHSQGSYLGSRHSAGSYLGSRHSGFLSPYKSGSQKSKSYSESPEPSTRSKHENLRSRSRSKSTSIRQHRSQRRKSNHPNLSHSRSPKPSAAMNSRIQQNSRIRTQCKAPSSIDDALDRRLTRMEVTINKIFVMVGDVIKYTNKDLKSRNRNRTEPALRDRRPPSRFTMPEFPIYSVKNLAVFSKMLKRKDVYSFLIEQEKDYCAPRPKSTDNVVMIAYLKRFITLDVRCDIALKDGKGRKELTLFGDFNRVYNFLIDVMKSGYKDYDKRIKSTEVHNILRTVWGRSNQMLQEEIRKGNK